LDYKNVKEKKEQTHHADQVKKQYNKNKPNNYIIRNNKKEVKLVLDNELLL